MDQQEESRLFEVADLILAVGRQIQASKQFAEEFADGSWTPLESAVMRYIDRNPGTLAGDAAEATRVVSTNFSRAVRGLEKKGLVRREFDTADARRVHLYPTERAQDNLRSLRTVWSRLLHGIVDDPDDVERLTALLRRIEVELALRARHDTNAN